MKPAEVSDVRLRELGKRTILFTSYVKTRLWPVHGAKCMKRDEGMA